MKNNFRILLGIVLMLSATSLFATNGMNMIGFGARMSGMGGVSLGMSSSANLMNTNPAGITTIKGSQFDYGMAMMLPSVHFKNFHDVRTWNAMTDSVRMIENTYYVYPTGWMHDTTYSAVFAPEYTPGVLNDKDAEFGAFPLPAFSFVNSPVNSRWSYGFGMYAQGGMGASYEDIRHDVFRDFEDQPDLHDIYVYQDQHEYDHYSINSGYFYNESTDEFGNVVYSDSTSIMDVPVLVENPYSGLKYHSKLAYMKFVQTLAYKLTDDVSVGVAFNFGFAMMEMAMPYSMSPDLMVGKTEPMVPDPLGEEQDHTFGEMFSNPPEKMGLGYSEVTAYALLADKMQDAATATSVGIKLGVRYQLNDRWSFGSAYTPQVNMEFTGNAIMDMTVQFQKALGEMTGMMYSTGHNNLGQPDYSINDAQTDVSYQLSDIRGINLEGEDAMISNFDAVIDFAWPQQFGFGFAYEKNDKLIIAGDFQWLDWSETMENFVMHFMRGDNANINLMMDAPDGNLTMYMPLNWKDQFIIALGAEYRYSDVLALRCGFNYGNNPVPANTVIPIFPAVVENHFTMGFGYRLSDNFRLDCAYEYVPKVELKSPISLVANEYDGSTSSLGENTLHFSLSRQF